MKYVLYIHITPNKKVYIGISSKSNINERWRSGRGYQNNTYFYRAILKYGWKNIEHKILFDGLTEEEAKQKEIETIAKYKSNNKKFGYNLSIGGESSYGYKHTKEQIEKQKKNRSKPQYTEDTRLKMSVASKKNWENPQYKEKMKEIHRESFKNGRIVHNKGKHLSIETKQKLRQTRKVKPIKCLETNEIYRGTRDVAEKLNVDRRKVMRILRKEKGFVSVKGYHFEYV